MSYFQIDSVQIEWTTIILVAAIGVVFLLAWNVWRKLR